MIPHRGQHGASLNTGTDWNRRPKKVVLDCCEGGSQREALDNLVRKVNEEKTLKVESLVKLLGAVKASFPGLQLL